MVVFRDAVLLFCELGSEFRNVLRWFSGFRSSYYAEQLFVLSLNFHDCPYSAITRRNRQAEIVFMFSAI